MFVVRSVSERDMPFISFVWLVVCLCLWHETKAEQLLRIVRDIKYKGDDFMLPKSLCHNSNQDPCLRHSATRNASLGNQGCMCYCPSNRATFYEPTRLCEGNQFVRENGGKCKFHFLKEDPKGELQVLSFATPRQIKAPIGKECKIDLLHHTGNMYLNCNGEWKAALINELIEKFEVKFEWSSSLTLKLKEDVNRTTHPHLNGRITRLAMNCRTIGTVGPTDTSCLLFKVQGVVTCPLVITQPTRSTASITTPGEILTSVKVTSVPPKTSGSIAITNEALTTKVTKSPVTGNASGMKRKPKENQNLSTTMAGVVGGVGGGLLLILVSALLARQWRKKRTRVRSDDVDGHQMYTGPIVATIERERALTITRDSERYTETWYEEVPEDKTKEKETGESVYQELSSLSQVKTVVDSQLYDDVVTPLPEKVEPTSFNQSNDPIKKGFCNPGFEGEPGIDNKRNNNSSATSLDPSGIETKEVDNVGNSTYDDVRCRTEISAAKSNGEYVEKKSLLDDGKHETLTEPDGRNFFDSRKISTPSGEYAYARTRNNRNLKGTDNLKSKGDADIRTDYDYANSKQVETQEDSNPPYGNINLSFVGDSDYVIPNTSSNASQTSTEASRSAGYELMGKDASVVDEAGYSQAAYAFQSRLSTHL